MPAGSTDNGESLSKPLSEPVPVPARGVADAVRVLESGRLFRYGEDTGGESHAARLEEEFATYLGRRYAVGLNSCGSAMFLALKGLGVRPDDPVLFNAFTLAPVPGAIAHACARPIPVECGSDLRIDLADLRAQAARTEARVLLLSHMRGHVADLEAIAATCDELAVALIEDCAHTLGARWAGRLVGTFGKVACFSTQSFKHLNSGEGGLLVTDDDHVAAAAILGSGSYALYGQHAARPALEVFERLRGRIPNYSLRLSELAAALVRPQLAELPARVRTWNAHYRTLAAELAELPGVELPRRDPREELVGSSIQFFVRGRPASARVEFLVRAAARGVHLKWFGTPTPAGFTERREHWAYISDDRPLRATARHLDDLFDMRIPLGLTAGDCRTITTILRDELAAVDRAAARD